MKKLKKSLALLVLAAISLTVIFSACSEAAPPVTDPVTTPATDPITDPVTDPVTDPITEPVTEPITDPVTEPATEPATEPVITPAAYDYSKPVPASAMKDNSWFDGAVFIGDSRIQGFMLWSGVTNATYIAYQGMMVNKFFTDPDCTFNGTQMTGVDALKSLGTNYNKVYINLGLNELGWSYYSAFTSKIGEMIDTIRANNPDADIYLINVIPVSDGKSASVPWLTRENVASMNKYIADAALDKQVYLVDAHAAFADANGYLPADLASDGVHLNSPSIERWRQYLLTHTVED